MPTKLDKILYTAHAHTTGGREGRSSTSDGILRVTLTPPKEMGVLERQPILSNYSR